MRIVLSTSPHVQHAAVLQGDFKPSTDAMYSFVPVGLLSLIAQLRQNRPQDDCTIYDINRRIASGELPLDGGIYLAIAAELAASGADIIGFMTECDSYHHVLRICDAIKAQHPGCRLVLGGPHASVVAAQTMKRFPCIDAIVIGEGELSFSHLMESFSRETDEPIPGVLRRLKGDLLVDGGLRPLIGNLDTLPMPAYELYSPDLDEEIFLEVGRGCPFPCEFCSTAPYWHRKHRVKSASRISHEIRFIKDLFGKRRIHFTHDLFTANRTWVMDICKQLISDGQPVRWTCSARTDTVDQPLLELMAKAGCDSIYFGIESGSERVLRSIKKDIPLSRSFEAIRACIGAGIAPSVGFIVGLPCEDSDSLKDTLSAYESILRMGCRHVHIFCYNPFPGSPIYSTIDSMKCDGHFVDLALGFDTDIDNRKTIAGNRDLFGSYFRPTFSSLAPWEEDVLSSLDEISPLVEVALMPTLVLAKWMGGMHKLFMNWTSWIRRENISRGAASYRIGYGSPALFVRFVLEELCNLPEVEEAAIAAAKAIEINLRIGEIYASRKATTMANHRSLSVHRPQDIPSIYLTSQLSCKNVIAIHSSDFDLRPVLKGEHREELSRVETYLIWQVASTGSVRLLDVSKPIYDIVQSLLDSQRTAGDLMLQKFSQEGSVDPDHFLYILSSLAEAEIVNVGG